MSRWKWLLLAAGAFFAAGIIALYVAAPRLARRFDPMVREQAIKYLRERFHSDVEIGSLRIHLPKLSRFQLLLKHERGARVQVDGEGLSMRFGGARDLPPLFTIQKFAFDIDLQALMEAQKTVDEVNIEGMRVTVPPKDENRKNAVAAQDKGESQNVVIKNVHIKNATLILLPKDNTKTPLRFEIAHLNLNSVAAKSSMHYDALLAIPRPPGQVHSHGDFGPWAADEPGDTPLAGDYVFNDADLGVFNGIAGILKSSGNFEGVLDSVHAKGEASVPDFRLKMAGNKVPLWTSFEVLVDGTNGDTVLRPVHARLGNTSFTTTGAVIKHEGAERRSIDLRVIMPNGDLRDLLRLATKGPPFMEGRIGLRTLIRIPPLSSKVREKLILDGEFDLQNAKFLKSSIQDQIDMLSRKGQGQPRNEEIDEVVSDMMGSFRFENQVMTFKYLSFMVPGARVHIAGDYNLGEDTVDFHGDLKLGAKVSQTQSGWKRWALKPVDPFFAKNGAGTFLHIKVVGSAEKPKFGLDRSRQ